MKPERSELVVIEEQEQKSEGRRTSVMRTFFSDLFRKVIIKGVSFLTRRWAPKVNGQPEGGERED